MRVGIMGGTLDPVHNGHLMLAREARRVLNLDRVMLLPAGDPPHKTGVTLKEDRLAMARLAAQEVEGLFICCIESDRPGRTYTVDTLTELRCKNPNTQWYYIIGADTLEQLKTWRNFERVAGMCTFAVVGRADDNVNLAQIKAYEEKYGAKFEVLPVNGPDISSTEIRNRVIEGKSITELVPTTVCKYIKDRSLYMPQLTRGEIQEKIRVSMKPSRYAHTLGVAKTAKRLAVKFGIDEQRAEIAGLLHDCAKCLDENTLRDMVKKYVPDADAQELSTESLLHAPAGAVLAAREYRIRDREILSAIRKHTIGAETMTPLEALIYTADMIEPTRKPFDGLDEARKLAEENLYAAMCLCAELTHAHIKEQGRKPHPKSESMLRNYGKEEIT